jgi:hypothetical protein
LFSNAASRVNDAARAAHALAGADREHGALG